MRNLAAKLSPWHLFLAISVFFVLLKFDDYNHWKVWKTPLVMDAEQYYSYLTSTFIHHDSYFHFQNKYWLATADNGGQVPRYTMGVAVMEAPFFFAAHAIANLSDYAPDGYSEPYVWCVCLGAVVYVFMGLYFLYKTLLFFFQPVISMLTVFAVFFATNLFYYTISCGLMSHSFAFSMFCLFLFATLKLYKERKARYLFLSAFSAGMIALIRPTDMIVLIIPLFLGVHSRESFRSWRMFLWSKRTTVLLAATLFLLTISPQLIYWKLHTGHFLFYGYGDEHFYFRDPQVVNFLLSYRKGLIPYVPVMVLAFLGMITLYLKNRELFWPVLLFNSLNIYMLSCWWDWSYGGSFGNRALIQSFAVLAIPLAALLNAAYLAFRTQWKKKAALLTIAFTLCLFSTFNLWIIRKYMAGLIHFSYMNKQAYWFVMTRNGFTAGERAELEKMFRAPDWESFRNGSNRND